VVWNGITRHTPVIPAKAGIQSIGHGWAKLFGVDSRFRGNDGRFGRDSIPNVIRTFRLAPDILVVFASSS
jgi:hypothetical protein